MKEAVEQRVKIMAAGHKTGQRPNQGSIQEGNAAPDVVQAQFHGAAQFVNNLVQPGSVLNCTT
jgi:hypothetical protein